MWCDLVFGEKLVNQHGWYIIKLKPNQPFSDGKTESNQACLKSVWFGLDD